MLTTVYISRKNLKDALNNILKDLNVNIEDFQTHSRQKKIQEKLEKLKKSLLK